MKKTVMLFSLLFALAFSNVTAETRPPAVSGTFYPDDPSALRAMVDEHLAAAEPLPVIDGRIMALIVPHAGLVYSGAIAAHAYRLLQDSEIDRVILCGPSHRYAFKGISVYGPGVVWSTPLGKVPCDDDYCNRLLKRTGVGVIPKAHQAEHSLEVQLPYLQAVLPEFRIIPISVGHQGRASVEQLTEALIELPDDEHTIMIATTDWQHYRSATDGWKMDSLGIACLTDFDADQLQHHLETGTVEACGGGPTVAVMRAALVHGANRVKLLRYGDSGDISGDKSSVVGYVAAVIYRDAATTEEEQPPMSDSETYSLSETDKELLLSIARSSIAGRLGMAPLPEFDIPDQLREAGAAFVTLEKHGRLRGCIGYTTAVAPLHETVAQCAISAAVNDRRFPPVTAEELPSLHVEISVLTPLMKVESLDEIVVGRDGLMIVKGQSRGLLLPQVATDYGWNPVEFLQQTCRKAGLPAEAYREPDAEIFRFEALIFSE